MKKLGIYLHIPFCKSKCHYCDFCSFPNQGQNEKEKYCLTLQREIALRARELTEYEVDTVYFGGGTPTALQSALLCSLLETVKAHFRVSENAEITAECNPATADTAYFAAMREAIVVTAIEVASADAPLPEAATCEKQADGALLCTLDHMSSLTPTKPAPSRAVYGGMKLWRDGAEYKPAF